MARNITVALELDDRGFNRGMRSADGQVNKLSKGFGGLGTAMKAATAIATGFAVKGIFDATLKMENFRTTLTAYLGSQKAANSEIERLTELANKLPQDLDNITAGFIILQRNGIDSTSASLEAFSKIAAGNSKDFTQLAEAVADALTGEFERLKEFGVKVSKENDKFSIRFADGSTKVVNSAMEVVNAVKEQGEEGGKFADVIAGPMNQAFSNLRGVLFEVSSAFGEGFAPAISEAAESAKAFIKSNKEMIAGLGKLVGEGLQWMLDNLDTIVTGIKAFVAAWVTFKVASLVTSIGTLVTGLMALRTAILSVNLALLANPVTAVAAAFALAAAAIVYYWEPIKAFFKNLFQDIVDFGKMSALQVELAWDKLKSWFLGSFVGALQAVSDAFFAIGREAQAAFAGAKAAALDPLNAFDAYQEASDRITAQLDAQRAAQDTMADSAADAADAVAETEAEIKRLQEAIENRAKKSTQEQAEVLELIVPAAKEAAAATETLTEETKELTKAQEAALKQANKLIVSQKGKMAKDREQIKNQIELLDYYGEERKVKEQLNKIDEERSRALARIQALDLTDDEKLSKTRELNKLYDEQSVAVEKLSRELYEASRSFEQGFKEAYNTFKEDSTNAATLASDLFVGAAADWRDAWVEAAETGDLSFGSLIDNMKKRLVMFLADAAFIKLTDTIADAFGINLGGQTAGSGGGGGASSSSSSGGGGGSNILKQGVDWVKGLFGFAEGGYVAGNKSVIVGERGPEIFTPAGSGSIIPNFAGGGGGTTQVTYNINAVDSASFVDMLSEQPEIIHSLVMDQDTRMFSRRL